MMRIIQCVFIIVACVFMAVHTLTAPPNLLLMAIIAILLAIWIEVINKK